MPAHHPKPAVEQFICYGQPQNEFDGLQFGIRKIGDRLETLNNAADDDEEREENVNQACKRVVNIQAHFEYLLKRKVLGEKSIASFNISMSEFFDDPEVLSIRVCEQVRATADADL